MSIPTSNSGIKFQDLIIFFKSRIQGPILGSGGAAHPGLPPWRGSSRSFKCGAPIHHFQRTYINNNDSQSKYKYKVTWNQYI